MKQSLRLHILACSGLEKALTHHKRSIGDVKSVWTYAKYHACVILPKINSQ
jgi:hypothetical protein